MNKLSIFFFTLMLLSCNIISIADNVSKGEQKLTEGNLVSAISMNVNSLTLNINETFKLTANVTPENADNTVIDWYSTDNNIAAVDINGMVTAKGPGTAIITATTTDGSNLCTSCIITVTDRTDFVFHIDNIEGESGSMVTIPIHLYNESTIKGFDIEFWYPEGFEFISYNQTDRFTEGSSITGSVQGQGNGYKFIAFNLLTNVVLEAGNGPIIYVTVRIPDNAYGNYDISLKNISLSTESGSVYLQDKNAILTVLEKPVMASSIQLNQTSAVMNEGETLQLTATVLPEDAANKTVVWTSSNSSVATVNSNGLVTAKSLGSVIITARTTDGSNLTDFCEVTVKQNTVLATAILLNQNSADLSTGETLQLAATVLPEDATNKMVTWSTSNADVAIVDENGLVTAISPGNASITATLDVNAKPDVILLTEGDWSNVPQDGTDHASTANEYLPEGWTFSGSHFYLDGGFISPGRNDVITANCDMAGYNKVSVIVTGKAYTKGVSTTLDVATDMESQRLTLVKALDTYLVVLEAGESGQVTFTCGYFPEIQSIKIYGGEITNPEDSSNSNLLSASCEVTVRSNTEPDPNNYFHIENMEVFRGETLVIPVQLTNEESILAFQTDITLPEGFNVLTDEDDEFLITPSSRLTSDHVIMAEQLNNGNIRVICYTPQSKVISGNEGDLFYISVAVPDNAGGDYDILLQNTLLTTSDYSELYAGDTEAIIHVNTYIPGDVNDSRTVTVTDIVFTAQYIMERNPSPFIFAAADMNGDGNITVTDIMLIARLIMTPTMTNTPKHISVIEDNSDYMCGKDINIAVGETRSVTIALNNATSYSAFQLDLTMPDGLTASNFALTDRAGSHNLDMNMLADGKTRALCYTPAMIGINGHDGALLTFDVSATNIVKGDIMVDGIEFVTSDCQTVFLNGLSIGVNNSTTVNQFAADKSIAKIEYFNLTGQQLSEPTNGVILVVTTYTDGTRSANKIIR